MKIMNYENSLDTRTSRHIADWAFSSGAVLRRGIDRALHQTCIRKGDLSVGKV